MPGVSLALSLHAPNQALRQSIVPSARAYKLNKLMAAVDKYEHSSGQKVSTMPIQYWQTSAFAHRLTQAPAS